MARQRFLVTGATGDTGSHAVKQLLVRGHQVRALAHGEDNRSKQLQKIGAEVVIGDFLDFDAMRTVLQGVRGAYFCYPIRPGILQATAYFSHAAKEAGVDCIVNMSQISAREDAKSHAMCDQWLAERLFDWSGLTVAHLRDFRKTLELQYAARTDRSHGRYRARRRSSSLHPKMDHRRNTTHRAGASLGIYRK